MKKKRYRVTVKAVGSTGGDRTVGTVVIEAHERVDAERMAIQKLWGNEQASAGGEPQAHAERITGEGG